MNPRNARFRSLKQDDLERMNIPTALWRSTIAGVPEQIRPKIAMYLSKIHDAVDKGAGILLTGNPGVGKTGIASLIAKQARSYLYTAYFTTFWELRDAVKNEIMFDESSSVITRAKAVDVLILDNMRIEDGDEKYGFSMRAIQELLAYRQDRQKITILTTMLNYDRLNGIAGMGLALSGFIKLEVVGPNLREKAAKSLKADLMGGK